MSLHELFGIDLPLIQAPMAGAQNSALTIAVSSVGALGSLGCATLTPEAIRNEVNRVKAQTDRPFNVNFFCHQPAAPDLAREKVWQETLAPYYKERGLDLGAIPAGAARTPFNAETAAIVEEFRPPVVSFHFGLPSAELVARVKATGAKILSSATTVDEAIWLEAHGVDAIIAQGVEAGGHRGIFLTNELMTQVGTFALVPQIVRAVNRPVIAAGGIADARCVAAALALGASGVQAGTAYLLCPEATISDVHRAALRSEKARHTALTNIFTGRPARSIVNTIMKEIGPISALAPAFPFAGTALAPLRQYAEKEGSGDFTPLWCGQNATGCKEIPAAELTRELVAHL